MTAAHASSKPLPAPEWLTLRSGSLYPGIRPDVRFVMVGNQPLYRLDIRPAGGQFACSVTTTVNAKRLDDPASKFASLEEAFAGGLEQLRTKLGW